MRKQNNNGRNTYRLGIDIGSTTLKVVVLDASGQRLFSDYRRHNANIRQTGFEMVRQLYNQLGECELQIAITGSVGMGYAERLGFGFVQEVVAAAATVEQWYPEVRTFIDMGGEDSKMIFFEQGKIPDIRMNGSCAGGTGAFIDQTATLLGVNPSELDALAAQSTTIYPIASRCGVFSKTDIQNLISRKVSRADIAASVFNAVALQVVASLARGMDILPKIFFCGGPFAFLPQLKLHFMRVLGVGEKDCILPEGAQLIPATGCALLAQKLSKKSWRLSELAGLLRFGKQPQNTRMTDRLDALFGSENAYRDWLSSKNIYHLPSAVAKAGDRCFLGVDSGSTTTKIVLLNEAGELVYSDYRRNNGDSFDAFHEGLKKMYQALPEADSLEIAGSCVTGYGENLLK
ncbi:MAG: 2-hydroxyglutaryl-CoA dehydratase, partial [Paludibacteraceae bacterium]|nr:2-hydroxyglutaryl-CoA dehydratase [Paludibacteraceae bacterium]